MPSRLATDKVRANKQVSHLTFDRAAGTGPDFDWRVDEIVVELDGIVHRFESELLAAGQMSVFHLGNLGGKAEGAPTSVAVALGGPTIASTPGNRGRRW
jgi:hypothetical protein